MIDTLTGALEAGDAPAVVATLADDVTLRVAVHDAPIEGREAAGAVLGAVLDGVLTGLRATETVRANEPDAPSFVLFTATVAGYPARADGLLVTRQPPGRDRITDVTVFLRPLDALAALADEMGRRMGGPRPTAEGPGR